MPRTIIKCSTRRKLPYLLLWSMIRWASIAPIPGSFSSSATEARFKSRRVGEAVTTVLDGCTRGSRAHEQEKKTLNKRIVDDVLRLVRIRFMDANKCL